MNRTRVMAADKIDGGGSAFLFFLFRREVEDIFRAFLPASHSSMRRDIISGLLGVLKELRAALESSPFFAVSRLFPPIYTGRGQCTAPQLFLFYKLAV
jgi:hypothetical protein